MFLFERLFALAIYVLILLIVCFFLSQRNSNYKRIFFIYTLLLAIMGFFYVPYITSDLYRIYQILESFSRYNWDKFVYYELDGDFLKVDFIYYWLIAKTGEFRLLPAINAILCYSCIFYIISRTADKYNISRKNIALATFFFMSIGNYMFVITGIRCMLGISLMSFCFFRENVEKKFKWWHIPIYLFAVFVHHFVFVLMIGRLIVPILTRKMSVVKKFGYLIFLAILALLAITLFRSYIGEIINKGESYIEGNMYSYLWEYIVGGFCAIIMFFSLIEASHEKIVTTDLYNWKTYLIGCIVLAVCFCFEFTIFHRLITYIAPIILLPILMVKLQYCEGIGTKKSLTLKNSVLFLTVIMLLIVCARGTLCSLKFFVL